MAKKKKSTTFRVDKRVNRTTEREDDSNLNQEWIKQTGGLSEEAALAWIDAKVADDETTNETDYRVVGE
tara:strand:- start:201 stop:407 length:207 start_codon:yes stop_codon:yes gene_type:complete